MSTPTFVYLVVFGDCMYGDHALGDAYTTIEAAQAALRALPPDVPANIEAIEVAA